jgi:hypothetical protein
VKVDWSVTDVATTETRDERLTQLVKQWAAEQDWNSRRTGVSIDVDHASLLNVARVESHHTVFVVRDGNAVQLQESRNDFNIADKRNVFQNARLVGEQRGNHGLGNQVLGTANIDATLERLAAVNCYLTHVCL